MGYQISLSRNQRLTNVKKTQTQRGQNSNSILLSKIIQHFFPKEMAKKKKTRSSHSYLQEIKKKSSGFL